MCGRYYIDDGMEQEIEKLLRRMDEHFCTGVTGEKLRTGDYCPSQRAFVVGKRSEYMSWGIKSFDGKTNLFNARAESVLTKPAFRESVQNRRIVIPASGFYEWNANKEKNRFLRKDKKPLLFAGCFQQRASGCEFTIITTKANASMRPVHDRMPLILEENELLPWIFDDKATQELLQKTPVSLNRECEYEQISLFSIYKG